MAILQTFAIHDSAVEQFITPFFMQTERAALRAFAAAAREEGHDFHKHSADYTLFHLGEFDQATALYTALVAPKNLGNAVQFAEEHSIPLPLQSFAPVVTERGIKGGE